MITGIILFPRREELLTQEDYSVLRLLEAAKSRNIKLKVIAPEQFELIVTNKSNTSILVDDEPIPLPDFVIPRMGSHTTFYAFSILRQLEYMGIYICNNADSIYSVKDKLYMHQRLANSKLATPNTMLAKFPVNINVVKREIGFPLVIKNVSGTQGQGIYLCESEDKFIDIMELIYTNNNKANIILQEFISESKGQDLRVFVVGGKVIGCMHRSSQNSFKANFSKGAEVNTYPLTPEIEWLALETAKLLKLDIAGVDLLFDKDGFKICEANSAPGFIGMEKVMGKNIAESILDFICVRLGLNLESF
ncbi:MAG: RimK family alpha-L-glutamate ligase [Rickettsiales bacterium]